ncbi:putative ribonuclease H-like domain-containing protein [Tanacetum coccineum]
MAYSDSGSDNDVTSCSKECVESYAKLKKLHDKQREQLGDASIEIQAYTQALKMVEAQLVAHQKNQLWYEEKIRFMKIDLDYKTDVLTYHKKLLAEAIKEKEELKTKLKNFQSSSKSLKQNTYSPSSKADKRDWNGLLSKRLGLGYGFTKKACFVCGSFSHLIRDCDFQEKRMAKQVELNKRKGECTGQGENKPVWNNVQRLNHQNKFVPKAVLTKTGIFPVNTARQNLSSQAATTSIARKVNIARPIVNKIRPRNNFYKSHSPIRRPFNRTTAPRTKFSNQKVNTARDKAVSAIGGITETADNPQRALKNKGIVDSGCSRHIIGNKAYLVEYQDYNGGHVAFGGSKGYITGKGKIKIGKLDFKDVCFVKELQHFNLFSVSQMYDKKNKVLFTYTKCLVLSSDFKLLDENQVLLRIPRQNNMYSFNLENIVPSGGLACLIAKAIVDESNKWHRSQSEIKDKGENPNKDTGLRTNKEPVDQEDQAFLEELERLKRQEKEANDAVEALRKEFAQEAENLLLQAGATRATSTNTINTISMPISTASPSNVFSAGGPALNNNDQDDSQIRSLEDIYDNPSDGIFTNASYDDEGAVADFTNLESTVNVSPIPTSRIHSIHPTTQILGDPKSAVQTRSKVHKNSGAHAFVSYIQKQRRNNHKDFQNCLFACFLSQIEPKKIFEALEDKNLPYGKKAIRTKWVYINKKDERGVVVRNKARIEAIRIFLAFASYMGFIVYQMNVKSAFLYGTIDEEVYVSQPPSFVDPKFPKKVYKFVKALYGLHQSPRAWYATLSTFLLKSGYRRGTIDKTLFIKKDKNDIMLVQVYVDDIIFGSTKRSWCDEFEALIKSRFQMSSIGELTFFLGLQTVSTPIETHKPLVKDEEAADVDVHLYRFQVTPKTSHLHVVKRIFRLISWQCKKQTIMATSTIKAEYVAAAN